MFSGATAFWTLMGMTVLVYAYLHHAPWGPVANGVPVTSIMGVAAVVTCLAAAALAGLARGIMR